MRPALVCLAVLGAAACAPAAPVPSAPGGGPPASNVTTSTGSLLTIPNEAATGTVDVEFPPERVWDVLPAVYQELGIPITTRDPATRTLGNARFRAPRRLAGERLSHYVSCGVSVTAAPLADTYAVRLSLRTQVVPAPGGSQVVTTVEATARSNEGTSGAPVGCTVNGRLPELVARMARLRAAGSA